ncbi:MAG: hypothetical protein QOK10_180, partial [Pseudonocardiales bacterium]|nr:hypothetical protein [Pseudonocardiales bacterium]
MSERQKLEPTGKAARHARIVSIVESRPVHSQ